MKRSVLVPIVLVAFVGCAGPIDPNVDDSSAIVLRGSQVDQAAHHDSSPPLTLLQPANNSGQFVEHEVKRLPRPASHYARLHDSVAQTQAPLLLMPATSMNFRGMGNGFSGPAGGFTFAGTPPDTNGDVGPNHYVQTVNTDFAIFNKSGVAVFGPVQVNTLFAGFGGGCETNNDGDPVVLYDPMADRWVISQFSVNTTPYLQCVAVSATPDPTGSYHRYAFDYGSTDFPDYPKMGVWPDAYYTSFNIFAGGSSFSGPKICAYDRTKMLAGTAATQQCFNVANPNLGGMLPSDMDGTMPPPAGSPNYVLALGETSSTLAFWKFHVDWTTPANTTLTGPTALTVAAYSGICSTSSGNCVPQPGSAGPLQGLDDRLMFRNAYRNFGDHQAIVVTHAVSSGSSSGIRWYELRVANQTPSVFQQGTYAPDANFRWLGSAAQDRNGNMAIGYSISSTSVSPSIRVSGRLAGDAAGTLGQGETTVIAGGGSQTDNSGAGRNRWGDYASMSIDPTDDCTFWFTTEYMAANGGFSTWSTRVASFKFPGCGGTTASDFSLSPSPSTLSLATGATGTSTISTSIVGSAGTVNLTASVSPAGPTVSLSQASVAAGSSATLTVNAGSAAAGNYTVTVTGTEGSATHATTVAVTVTAVSTGGGLVNGGFESGLTGWTATGTTSVSSAGHTGSAAQLGATSPTNGDSTLSQTFTAPAGATSLSLYSKIVCPDTLTYDWATATLKDNTAGTTATVIARTCTNSGVWMQSTSAITAGHSYLLTLVSHDDNYASDPTDTLFDDVTLSSGGGGGGGIINSGFESGLTGWTSTGTTSAVSSGCHGGAGCARAGSTSPTNGDSTVAQTFTVPSGKSNVSLWYSVKCPDTVTYDWATVTLKDNTAGTTATVLAKTCSSAGTWTNKTAAVAAGHSYTLTLTSHDDNYSSDPTYTLFDDVTLN